MNGCEFCYVFLHDFIWNVMKKVQNYHCKIMVLNKHRLKHCRGLHGVLKQSAIHSTENWLYSTLFHSHWLFFPSFFFSFIIWDLYLAIKLILLWQIVFLWWQKWVCSCENDAKVLHWSDLCHLPTFPPLQFCFICYLVQKKCSEVCLESCELSNIFVLLFIDSGALQNREQELMKIHRVDWLIEHLHVECKYTKENDTYSKPLTRHDHSQQIAKSFYFNHL